MTKCEFWDAFKFLAGNILRMENSGIISSDIAQFPALENYDNESIWRYAKLMAKLNGASIESVLRKSEALLKTKQKEYANEDNVFIQVEYAATIIDLAADYVMENYELKHYAWCKWFLNQKECDCVNLWGLWNDKSLDMLNYMIMRNIYKEVQ